MKKVSTEKSNYTFRIPKEVSHVTETLETANYKAFLVGGCVRDLITGRKPKDWDVTTDATPEQIIALFPKTFYENSFGTVGVVDESPSLEDLSLKVIEVTPFRLEAKYSDNRRPDAVTFSKNIEDDLKRRDFTINALALSIKKGSGETYDASIIDLFEGRSDIAAKILRAVGNPDERLKEDALRILRAIRISTEQGFVLEKETEKAIVENAHLLKNISQERIRDEFSRILLSDEPMKGLILSHKLGILPFVIPELIDSVGVEQNQAHSFDVWEHLLRSLQHAADKNWPLDVRIAALLHDIAKPATRRKGKNGEWTFYGHEVVGSRMVKIILERLRYPKDFTEKVVKMVRWHMFFADTEQISLSAVRRIVANVGKESIWDLINLRMCDRIGTGRPKESPYRLRKYKSMIEEALRDPITVGMLKIDGTQIMNVTKIPPGPKIGLVLHALLEEVLDDPKKNTVEYLESTATELIKLPENELIAKGAAGKEKKSQAESESVEEIRKKHWVK